MSEDRRVAVWVWRYGCLEVTMCDDEAHAYRYAYNTNESDDGFPAGFQYSDGRFIDIDDDRYQSWRDAEDQRRDAIIASAPVVETRRIPAPFVDRHGRRPSAVALAAVPEWVGHR